VSSEEQRSNRFGLLWNKRVEQVSPVVRPSVAIVLVSTDGHAKFLPECLDSLPGACADLPFRVILVDNDGDSLSCQIARRYKSTVNLECLAQKRPKGFAANVNDALKRVTEPYVLLLNVDTVLPEGAVRRTVRVMEEHPKVAALTVRMRGKDGRLQASARAFPYPSVLLWDQLGLSRFFPKSRIFGKSRLWYVIQTDLTDADWASGAYLLLRVEPLRRVGGMDSGFHMYSEDTDLCYRLRKQGWSIVVDPSVEIFHWKDPLASTRRRQAFVQTHVSLLRFWDKHGTILRRIAVRLVLLVGIVGRFLTWPLLLRKGRSFAAQSLAAYWEVLGTVISRRSADRVRGKQ